MDLVAFEHSQGRRHSWRNHILINEEIPVGEQRWGNWTVLCPGALKPHQTTVDDTDSESEEQKRLLTVFFTFELQIFSLLKNYPEISSSKKKS